MGNGSTMPANRKTPQRTVHAAAAGATLCGVRITAKTHTTSLQLGLPGVTCAACEDAVRYIATAPRLA